MSVPPTADAATAETAIPPTVDGFVLLQVPPARGRTAHVYRGVSIRDGRSVAIKALTTSVEQSAFLTEAFQRETKALSELRHPNIVKMLKSGISPEGIRYIVLEWMQSDLVQQKARFGAFEWNSFWQTIGRPLTSAVAHAHNYDFAHRDLAPRNILFDDANVPRVADFGISKLRRFMRSEQTLKQFVSPPFTPPEVDDGSGLFARDVFSLGSLFCWFAGSADMQTYDEVSAFAASSDLFDSALREILASALSRDPDDRPRNADEFLERIERTNKTRVSVSEGLPCPLALAHHQVEKICRAFELSDRGSTEQAILEDLNAACGIAPKPVAGQNLRPADDPTSELQLFGLTHSYHARVDERAQDRLVILSARNMPTGLLERQREAALTPRMAFRFGSRGLQIDRQEVANLQHLLLDHLQAKAEEEEQQDSRLFAAWSRILQARQDFEAARERPVHYHGYQVDGRRIHFRTTGQVAQDVVLESRQVRVQDGSFLTGVIEALDGHIATFLVNSGDIAQLRNDGDITVNVYAASEALRRQQRALDAFRQRDVVKPQMADILIDPELAAPITARTPTSYFQNDLDPDKRKAVNAALGAEDVLLLRGPPGTGKTTFIAELILQTLRDNPEARILLASQTNVAIDNAIERVVKLRPQAAAPFEIVRLGTNDERISDSVEPYRLARRLEAWTKEVAARVEKFAEQQAIKVGVDKRTVDVGILLEKLLTLQHDEEQVAADLQTERQALEEQVQRRGGVEIKDPRRDLDVVGSINSRRLEVARLDEARRKLAELQTQTRRELAQLGEDEFASLRGRDLATAVQLHLEDSDAVSKVRPLLELGAEWMARFGRQDHFEAPFLSMANVVAGTCLGVVGPRSAGQFDFDLCVVDEASKATATEILVPLSRAKKWVLVGDSKQLPPFQDEALRNPAVLEKYDLRQEEVAESLFGYLERSLPAGNVLSLRSQRRMIQPINDLVAACFYPDQGLECMRSGPDILFAPALKSAVTWLDTSELPRPHETSVTGSGYFNRTECELISKTLKRLNRQFARRDKDGREKRVSVAVLTGYADQRAKLERTLNPRSPNWTHIEILLNTVDAFQGRQADVIIYSVTRSNPFAKLGFLKQLPRLNVALSRGRDALLIVGNQEFCRGVHGENPFRSVIDWIDGSSDCSTEVAG